MQVHDEVLGFGVSVAHLALVAVLVDGHLVGVEAEVRTLVTRLCCHRDLLALRPKLERMGDRRIVARYTRRATAPTVLVTRRRFSR